MRLPESIISIIETATLNHAFKRITLFFFVIFNECISISIYIYIYIIKRATSPSHQTLCYLSQALKVKHNSLILNLTMHSSNPYLNAFCLKDFRVILPFVWRILRLWTLLLLLLLFLCELFFFLLYFFIFNKDWTRNLPSLTQLVATWPFSSSSSSSLFLFFDF